MIFDNPNRDPNPFGRTEPNQENPEPYIFIHCAYQYDKWEHNVIFIGHGQKYDLLS